MRTNRFRDDDLAVWTAPDNWARRLMTQHAEAEAIEYYDLSTGRRASEGRGDPSPTLPLPTSEPGPAVHDAAPATPPESLSPLQAVGGSHAAPAPGGTQLPRQPRLPRAARLIAEAVRRAITGDPIPEPPPYAETLTAPTPIASPSSLSAGAVRGGGRRRPSSQSGQDHQTVGQVHSALSVDTATGSRVHHTAHSVLARLAVLVAIAAVGVLLAILLALLGRL